MSDDNGAGTGVSAQALRDRGIRVVMGSGCAYIQMRTARETHIRFVQDDEKLADATPVMVALFDTDLRMARIHAYDFNTGEQVGLAAPLSLLAAFVADLQEQQEAHYATED